MALRSILRYLGVNSGDMQKGVMRVEPNISVRPAGSPTLGTRTEIKNLNSFRALERSTAYEIQRQSELLRQGQPVIQETRGWDEARGVTFPQRSKEEAEDYRYFPEPDLPPLVVEEPWVEAIRKELPELPVDRQHRFRTEYGLNPYDANVLVTEKAVADYFEAVLAAIDSDRQAVTPKMAANWISGDLFALLNNAGQTIEDCTIEPKALADLLLMISRGEINQPTAKSVLAEMFSSEDSPETIVQRRGLRQVSDAQEIASWVARVLAENPD
jgi:aspartyl-tRNA(Asn)/glutamyl-tRNA(Gln) amidotransferase subunit B